MSGPKLDMTLTARDLEAYFQVFLASGCESMKFEKKVPVPDEVWNNQLVTYMFWTEGKGELNIRVVAEKIEEEQES